MLRYNVQWQVWQGKMPWLAEQLQQKGLKGVRCRLLKAREVYDETLADQFRALAGNPRHPASVWYDLFVLTRFSDYMQHSVCACDARRLLLFVRNII